MGNINRIVLGGTITQPNVAMINGNNGQQTKVARFVMQIARDFGQGEFDNVSCIAYGKQAEMVEQQFASGNAALIVKDGRIQTGSYTDQAGKRVYTTDVICSNIGLGAAYLNKSILSGNLTKNPDVRYTQGQEQTAICHFTIAVKRKSKDAETDFIQCTAFGKQAEFISKNFVQGDNLIVEDGRIQTGCYVNKDGITVNTTEVVVNAVEFGENKASRDARRANQQGGQQMPNNVVQMPTPVPQGMPMGAPVQQMPTAVPQGVPMGMPTGAPQMQAPVQAPVQQTPPQAPTQAQTPVQQTSPQAVVPQNPSQPPVPQTATPQAPAQTVPQTAPSQTAPVQTVPSTPPQAPAQAPVPQAVAVGQTPFGVVPMGEVFH